jgi:hypothetical protein
MNAMAPVFSITLTASVSKEFGVMARNTENVCMSGLTTLGTMSSILMERNKGKGYLKGLMFPWNS